MDIKKPESIVDMMDDMVYDPARELEELHAHLSDEELYRAALQWRLLDHAGALRARDELLRRQQHALADSLSALLVTE